MRETLLIDPAPRNHSLINTIVVDKGDSRLGIIRSGYIPTWPTYALIFVLFRGSGFS